MQTKNNQRSENVRKILNGRLHPEDGSDWCETLPKRVSDDSQHLIARREKSFLVEIFAAKCQHQMKNRLFRRSYAALSVIGKLSLKNEPDSNEFQVSTFPGEGVQRRFSKFLLTFGPKPTYSFSARMMMWWYDDMMIKRYNDMMIWWNDDMMIRWWYDDNMMIWGYDDMMIFWGYDVFYLDVNSFISHRILYYNYYIVN